MDKIYLKRALLKNFGDVMNDNLLRYILGRKLEVADVHRRGIQSIIAIGSILHIADSNTLVWGSGFISSGLNVRSKPKKIAAVRGPLTRNRLLALGLKCPKIFGDPALLYPRFYKPPKTRKYKLGIVAHYVDRPTLSTMRKLKRPYILDIDVRNGVNKVVNDICSCEVIASSSLHGIIIADAYGIPSIWIKITDRVVGGGYKFKDYFLSVRRPLQKPLVVKSNVGMYDILRGFHLFGFHKIRIDLNKLLSAFPIHNF